jgi:hypothetical protein
LDATRSSSSSSVSTKPRRDLVAFERRCDSVAKLARVVRVVRLRCASHPRAYRANNDRAHQVRIRQREPGRAHHCCDLDALAGTGRGLPSAACATLAHWRSAACSVRYAASEVHVTTTLRDYQLRILAGWLGTAWASASQAVHAPMMLVDTQLPVGGAAHSTANAVTAGSFLPLRPSMRGPCSGRDEQRITASIRNRNAILPIECCRRCAGQAQIGSTALVDRSTQERVVP